MDSEEQKVEILIVDDSKVVRWTAKKMLQPDYIIHEAASGLEGWQVLQQNPNIAAVFSDLQMEGSDGYELLALIRDSDDPRHLNLPVIIITGSDDGDNTKKMVLNLGATDFVVKPFDAVTLKNRADAYIGYSQKLQNVELASEQDKLTGLTNKRSYFLHGDQDLSLALRHKTELAVALLEVNHFMALVERYGKHCAAHILVELSKAIVKTLRREDISARVATARFALILPLTNRVGSLRSIERLCEEIDLLKVEVEGREIDLRISAGVAVLDLEKPCATFSQLVNVAEVALNNAIESGGGVVSNVIYMAQPPRKEHPAPAQPPVERQVEPVVPHIEISKAIAMIEAGEGGMISTPQLSQLMRRLLPLLNYADSKMELGMADSIERVKRSLPTPPPS